MRFFSIIASILLMSELFSCSSAIKQNTIEAGPVLQIDSFPASGPNLSKDHRGNIVLSWIRKTGDSAAVFCYAVSYDKGQSFEAPILVPGSENIQPHAENIPKIIFKPSGEVFAIWGADNPAASNKYAGLAFYNRSVDNGKSWGMPLPLVNDTAGYDQRYFDVTLLSNNEIGITWLDNRKTSSREGSALYFATTRKGQGFLNERLVAEDCCQCCRTDLFTDSKGGIHIVFRGIIQDSIRDMVHIVSMDAGNSFTKPNLISKDEWVIRGCPHTGPAITENKQGLHFAWFTGGKNKGCFYTGSTDNGQHFTGHDKVSELGSHPQLCSFTDGELALVWDEPVKANDKISKRVGFQLRTEDGVGRTTKFITPGDMNASYPVIATVSEKTALVAYTSRRNNKNYVNFQQVNRP